MGFSIESFFNTLLDLLEDESLDEIDKLSAIESAIIDGYTYAKECGQIKD